MHSLFTPADTLDGASFLHSVVQTNNSFDLQWLVPVTGLENNGQPVTPPSGFDLFLTIDASGIIGQTVPTTVASKFTSINVTLWADPTHDAGTASSTLDNGTSFSGNTANDIVLATGTMISGQMSVDPNTGVRMATDVEKLTPTLDGTRLLGGSIKPGDVLTEHFVTQPDEFQALPQPDGTIVDLVNNGAATVTLTSPSGDPATISIPSSTLSDALQLPHGLMFIHHHGWLAACNSSGI